MRPGEAGTSVHETLTPEALAPRLVTPPVLWEPTDDDRQLPSGRGGILDDSVPGQRLQRRSQPRRAAGQGFLAIREGGQAKSRIHPEPAERLRLPLG